MKKQPEKPTGQFVKGRPVAELPIEFKWHTNKWLELFDLQIALLKNDIARARVDDRHVVYLSCPISSRGGGYFATNVDIARHAERRLLAMWGERFWILNPAQYQMESKEGRGLLAQHAERVGMSAKELDQLQKDDPAQGGDYMRMWTKVLAEDGGVAVPGTGKMVANTGQYFDAFYFLGPTDVHDFFSRNGATNLTDGLEGYFSRKYATDREFRNAYAMPGAAWGKKEPSEDEIHARDQWELRRKDFIRFYSLRSSAGFSLGSHDEWNILLLLNERRLAASKDGNDVGVLLAAYFDGRQVAPGALVQPIVSGYGTPT